MSLCCGDPGKVTERPYTYLRTVQGVCRECRKVVDARIIVAEGHVWQERLCPEHGASRALIAEDPAWYLAMMRRPVEARPVHRRLTATAKGCPHDCGPCGFHVAGCNLPVFSITNACNLNCPICFTYNRPDQVWHMPLDEARRLLDFVVASCGTLDLINITGGEPTLHPQLLDLLKLATDRPEVGRVTLNSNGLRLAEDEDLVRALADLGVYVILSLDTFDAERSARIHGRDLVDVKRRALDNLERHGVGTTLLNVMIRDVNDDEIGTIIREAASRPFIRSVTVQTMTYTGMGGGTFPRTLHLPVDGAERAVERAMDGVITVSDFHPLPSAHPLCYGVAYFFRVDGELVPFRRLFSEDEMRRLIGPHYLMHPGDEFDALLKDAMNRLWAQDGDPRILGLLKRITRAIFPPDETLTPFERQRRAEGHVLTLYVHAHMDEDTFDVSRVCTCPDLVPDVNGTLTPACAYNVFYRQRDERFWAADDADD